MTDAVVRIQGAPQWFPTNLNILGGGVPVQVAGSRPGRATIVIINTGANTALIRATYETTGGYITLAPLATMSIDTEAEVYATVAAAGGTTLETIETVFPVGSGKVGKMPRYAEAFKGGGE